MRYKNIGSAGSQHQQIKQLNSQPKRKVSGRMIALIFVGLLVFGGISFALFGGNVGAFFKPVSVVSKVSQADLNETDGRTNVLILGSDKRVNSGINTDNFLTDTILVASIGRVDGSIVMISMPRDLWVKTPSGYHSKINAVYSYGGSEEMTAVVEDVLGIPVHYYVVVDFELFKEVINILGGVEVNIDNAFVDKQYPIEGMENAPLNQRYETISFNEGLQIMDGDTALKYVRSRKGNNGEDTDFARSRRQQKIIMAVKNKALSLETLIDPTKVKDLYDSYSSNVDTNITLNDAKDFYLLSQTIDFNTMRSIVLDDRSAADSGGLLYAPEDNSLYGGAYVLIPQAGNFSQMHAYVQRYLFGE